MNKNIEKEFFKAFDLGGVVHLCFDWMRYKYDLEIYISKEYEEKPHKALPEEWRHYYDVTLLQEIEKMTEDFDESVICYTDSPLMDEIANNIDSLTGKERDRYIFSLLKPFREFSDKVHPEAIIKQLKGEVEGILGIKDFEKDLAMWESMPQNEQLKDENGEVWGTPKEQADACRKVIEDCKYRIERTYYVADRYREILNKISYKKEGNTVEKCLNCFWHIVTLFANRLDALLLERGINLLWYQQESGIYLKPYRYIHDVDLLVGSYELAKKYIYDALPKLDKQQIDTSQHKANGENSSNEKESPHYHKNDETKAKRQFKQLVNNGYFPSDTSLDDWLYIYGVEDKIPNKKPLDWQKTQKELAYMIRRIWQNTDTKIWAICDVVFTIKGKKPNTYVMKSDLSSIDNGYKNRPKTFDRLEEVLKC